MSAEVVSHAKTVTIYALDPDRGEAVNGRLDDLGQRITAVETRLTSAENRMASSLTVNVWGATISGLIATAVAVIKLWT
jgi:hypothetical protein